MELNSERPAMDDEDLAERFGIPRNVIAEAALDLEWLKKLTERHKDRLAANPRLIFQLMGCARRLARETPKSLSERGRRMLAARGGRARWRSMTPEQRADLQAMAVAARKRKARERRETARVSDTPAADAQRKHVDDTRRES